MQQWMWCYSRLCFLCTNRVASTCMYAQLRMHNSYVFKYCSLESVTIFLLTTSRTHATFHEVIYNYKTAGAYYCTCLHIVWNVVVIPIDRGERRIKESSWQSPKIIFGTVS